MSASASAAALLRRYRARKSLSISSSQSTKNSIHLSDWWLIKADFEANGKRLGVGGFTTLRSQGIMVFHSAPIMKRLDVVTLQTADGIIITVRGHLNRSRTLENGFPLKVCRDFTIGFPFYWEEFATLSFDTCEMTLEDIEHVSWSDLPASLNDHLRALGDHKTNLASNNYFDDILQSIVDDSSCDETLNSENENSLNGKETLSSPDEALFDHNKFNAEKKQNVDEAVSIAEPEPVDKVNQKILKEDIMVVDNEIRTRIPLTRSRTIDNEIRTHIPMTRSRALDGIPLTRSRTLDGIPLTRIRTLDGIPLTRSRRRSMMKKKYDF